MRSCAPALPARRLLLLVGALCAVPLACASAQAQTSPAFGPLVQSPSAPSGQTAGAIPLDDYLALLQRISPAAEAGARDYLAAFKLRCGRALTAPELRGALADNDGDPVLKGFIRAALLQDKQARRQLTAQLRCPAGGTR